MTSNMTSEAICESPRPARFFISQINQPPRFTGRLHNAVVFADCWKIVYRVTQSDGDIISIRAGAPKQSRHKPLSSSSSIAKSKCAGSKDE